MNNEGRENVKVLLVAGHGEGDVGACGCGYREAELTREVAELLKKKLAAYLTVDVFDVRKNLYKYVSSGKRFDFTSYDYVLEVHFNAAASDEKGNGKITGVEFLVHTTAKAQTIGSNIVRNLSAVGFTNRGVKERNNLLVMNVCQKQKTSYGLLEVCFIDDKDDMNLYQKRKEDIIQGIAEGLLEGFGIQYNKLLETANDIVWELNHSYFPITETQNFVHALEQAKQSGSPLYWGYYKLVNKIK